MNSAPNKIQNYEVTNALRRMKRGNALGPDGFPIEADLGVKTKTQLMAEKSVFKILLMTIIAASAEPDLHDSQDKFVLNVCHHFAIISQMEHSSANASSSTSPLGVPMLSSSISVCSRARNSTSCDLKELDPLIFLDALVDVLADENRLHAKASLSSLNVFFETLFFLVRSKHSDILMLRGGPGTPMLVSSQSMSPEYLPSPSVHIPVFEQLLACLLHCCYGSNWQAQTGGVMGLGALVGKVTVKILCLFQVRIVRGPIYVLNRLLIYATKVQEETSQVLTQILCVGNNVDDLTGKVFKDLLNFLQQRCSILMHPFITADFTATEASQGSEAPQK